MAITFPNSPSSGDTHTTSNGLQYTYDGEKWTTIGTNSAGTWTRSGTTVSLTTAGDDLNVDSGTLFVDASTNRVGVGTTSPGVRLHVETTAQTALRLRTTGSTTANPSIQILDPTGAKDGLFTYTSDGIAVGSYTAHPLIFTTQNNERARIDSSGNVFIGGTTAASADIALNANGTARFAGGDFDVASSGRLKIQRTDDDTSQSISIKAIDGSSAVELYGSGRATFGGTPSSPSIDLKGSDGSASFSGGNINFATNGDGQFLGRLKIGGTDANPKIFLNESGGSASFSGGVKHDSSSTGYAFEVVDGSTQLIGLYKDSNGGNIYVRNSSGTSNISLNGNNGTASFSGGVVSSKHFHTVLPTAVSNSANYNAVLVDYLGTPTVQIKANGAASFAGAISTGGASASAMSATGARIRNTGDIAIRKDGSSASCFEIFKDGDATSNKTITFSNDGSATFSGYADFNRNASSGFSYLAIGPGGTDAKATFVNRSGEIDLELYSNYSASPTVSINSNGSATFTGSVTASNVSDIRFKENITDANPQLADAVALGSQLKNFDWNDDAPLNEELRAKRFLGLVAQEAEKVCPGLTYIVPRTKQGKELTAAVLDEDGNETKAATYEELDDSYKAINHDILVMKLLGAVAELSAEVAALKSA